MSPATWPNIVRLQSSSTDWLEMASRWKGCFGSTLLSSCFYYSSSYFILSLSAIGISLWMPLRFGARCCVYRLVAVCGRHVCPLMNLCHSAHGLQLLGMSHTFSPWRHSHTQNTNTFDRQERSLSLVPCIQLQLYTRTHLTRTTKHDKNSILCSTMLIMMMLISMCLPIIIQTD